MKWSWKLGRVAGIDIHVHATFLILLAYIAFGSWQEGGGAAAVDGVLFILAVFASVVAHEYAHALTARRYGVRTRDITLLPIGGVARLERIPSEPQQELWIAAAGPAFTIALAAALAGLALLFGVPLTAATLLDPGGPFVVRVLVANLFLAAFNLLPAFPMDGGRVLRALLAMRWSYVRATEVASGFGKAFALLFAIAGLAIAHNPILVLIAVFVWMGAAGEVSAAQARVALGGVTVGDVTIREARTLAPGDPVSAAVHAVLAGFQQDFPVLDGGRVVGVLTRSDMLRALAERGGDARVSDAMQREFQTAELDEPLERAVERLQQSRCRTLPVLSHGVPVGVLTLENIGEYLLIDAATRRQGGPGQKA